MDSSVQLPLSRSRLAWWIGIGLLTGVFFGFIYAFLGTFVLGLFLYYAVRPLHRRLYGYTGRRTVAATVTVIIVVLPVIALFGYVSYLALREFLVVAGPGLTETLLTRLPGDPETLLSLIKSPEAILEKLENASGFRRFLRRGLGVLGTVGTGLLHLILALAFAFFLLRDGNRLANWFRGDIAGRGSATAAYFSAVDADLGTVYFGNVITVMGVGATSLVVYHGFNVLAPAPLTIPFPTLLAILTGLATFVPLVVGKIVYLPIAGLLAYQSVQTNAGALLWVLTFLIVVFLSLDFVPQTVVRPYISGRTLHSGLILFAYVLGAALFGWYGLFLGPLLIVLIVQAANLILPELLHGEELSPMTHTAIGSDPDVNPSPDQTDSGE